MGTASLFFYAPDFGYFYQSIDDDNDNYFGCYVGEFSLHNFTDEELAI